MASNAHEVEVTDQNAGEVATKRTKDTVSPPNSPNSELLTVTRAAPLLGVTPQTVKNYIYKGILPTYKTPGGHHRIRREDLVKLGILEDGPSVEEMAKNYNQLHHGYIKTLTALTDALDSRDGIISGHSRRGFSYVAIMADSMGVPEKQQEEIKLGALLHDIGKVFISEHILSKPGRLTDQEHYFIRQHPEMGERIVSDVEFLQGVKPLIRHHHERFDGKGYPDGLSGKEIPLGARMIALAEAFDCITSDCTFQPKRCLAEAIDEIERHARTQFDPDIVRIFLEEVVSKLREGDIKQSGDTYFFHDGEELEGFRVLLGV
jgi:excisionase family DNA binding protein